MKKMSKTEREASTKALNELMLQLGQIEDDQLKTSMIMDKYKGKL